MPWNLAHKFVSIRYGNPENFSSASLTIQELTKIKFQEFFLFPTYHELTTAPIFLHKNWQNCTNSINPSLPNPRRREKINLNFNFTLLCGASKDFMKAVKFQTVPNIKQKGLRKYQIWMLCRHYSVVNFFKAYCLQNFARTSC